MGHDHAAHHHFHEKRGQTVVQYVYETASKTFDGPIGGYSTVNPPPTEPTQDSSSNQSKEQSNSQSSSQSDSSSNDQSDSSDDNSSNDQSTSNSSNNNSNNSNNDDSKSSNSNNSDSDNDQQRQEAAAASSSQAAAEAASSSAEAEAAATDTSSDQATTKSSSARTTEDTSPTTTAATSAKKAGAQSTANNPKTTPTPGSHSTPVNSNSNDASTTSPSIGDSSTSSSAPTPTSSASGGLSPGGKAGLAIGILLIIGLLAGLAFLCFRRQRKRQNSSYEQAHDEKAAYTGGLARAGSTVSTRTTATAPRLSLRPVTQFSPDLAARGKAANEAGQAAMAGAGSGAGVAAIYPNGHHEQEDPFGNHAEISQQPQRLSDESGLPIQTNTPEHTLENPFGNHAEAAAPINSNMQRSMVPAMADTPAPLRIRTPTPEQNVAAAAAGAAGAGAFAGAGALAAKRQDGRKDAPRPLDTASKRSISPSSASPAASDFSQTPASPGAMASGPPPSNVHRIQLDFKPSMDDELGLRAGQLVRLLHEYDDGWALCIRLDRSQQGVAPRTCLSARPVKPRPPPGTRGPPPLRGMMGPGQQRPSSPAGGRGSPSPYNRAPRPMAPGPHGGQQRSMSPGPYGGGPQHPANNQRKRRSNSASDVRDRRNSPPGPSPMNPNMQRMQTQYPPITGPNDFSNRSPTPSMSRKPVPGQAM